MEGHHPFASGLSRRSLEDTSALLHPLSAMLAQSTTAQPATGACDIR